MMDIIRHFPITRGRVRQTWQALTAPLRSVDDALAQRHLSPASFALFMTMPRRDRQHHLRVLRLLLANNDLPETPATRALYKAALLHDVGKTQARFTIFDRILVVLIKKIWPHQFAQWSQGDPHGWRRPFVVSVQHPRWGADMLRLVDDDMLACQLILHHQDTLVQTPNDATLRHLLALLQAADDMS
jgi:hypothetical protein